MTATAEPYVKRSLTNIVEQRYDFVNGTFYVKIHRIDRTYDPCRLHLQPVDNIENVVQRALEFRASPDYVRCDPATILFL